MKPRIMNPMPDRLGEQVMGDKDDFLTPSDIPTMESSSRSQRESARNSTNVASSVEEDILNEKIQQDIQSVSSAKNVVPKNPRDILKTLIARGEYREDVELFGYKWTLKALDQRDILLAMEDLSDLSITDQSRITTLLFAQVVYAIEAVEGIQIYEWFTDIVQRDKYSSTEEYKVAVRRVLRRYLEKLPPSAINSFNVEYAKIENKRNEAIENLKNS